MSQASQSISGVFGKLPNYGDFLSRDLPSQYIDIWDSWLQGYVSGSQEQLGEHWLDIYLTSPIWRFTLSPGVIDDQVWVGLMLPSVDRVGRYFPFSVVCSLQTDLPVTVVSAQAQSWFETIETILFNALEGQLQLDELLAQINAVPLILQGSHQTQVSPHSTLGTVVRAATEVCDANQLYPLLLDTALKQLHTSYSIWSTVGSEYVEPCTFVCKALPALSGIAAMLDGDWTQSQWCEPFWPLAPTPQHEQTSDLTPDLISAPLPEELVEKEPDVLIVNSPLEPTPVYIPEDFLEEDLFAEQDKETPIPNDSVVTPTAPLPITLPISPDITQPRPIDESLDFKADSELDLPADPFATSLQESGLPIDRADVPADPFAVFGGSDTNDIQPNTPLAVQEPTESAEFIDPFASSASIPLDADSFEISGVDASNIEISDADPFGLALDPGSSGALDKRDNSES